MNLRPRNVSTATNLNVRPARTLLAIAILLLSQQYYASALTFNYFAYGSNVYAPTMTDMRNIQCVSSTAAILDGYKLRFNIPGIPAVEPSWACVEASKNNNNKNEVVHGVMYTLTPQDFARISMSEGVPFGYQWKVVDVVPYQGDGMTAGRQALMASTDTATTDSATTSVVKAYTLITNNPFLRRDIPPSKAYRDLLIKGARDFYMDQEYVEQLEAVPIGFTIGEGFVAKDMLEAAEKRAAVAKRGKSR